MNKKSLLSGLLIVSLLTGCGTISRGHSFEKTYRGFDQDKEVISNPYMWMLSFGLIPVFFIASAPIDLAIDTVLYPVDYWRGKSPRHYTAPAVYRPVYAVNLTGKPDFEYLIKEKSTRETLVKGVTRKVPLSGKQSSIININKLISASFPPSFIKSVTVEGMIAPSLIVSDRAISNKNEYYFTPDDDLRVAKGVLVVFMPCSMALLFDYDSYYYNGDFIRQQNIQDYYHSMTSLEEKKQCVRAEENTLAADHMWKRVRFGQ
ncbi:YceK/YidQ family lipoprotein [Pantoea vagans]|uniref:YceK/YidQ family lipoprotein n=1 Tax=Pantoea vagans TaxID=470934 RepID=UPI0010935252|nr:YceK/YidQ family lipoprotein [Pantoea vagans]QCA06317.1 YceK/YidQ family lipoprotein [Pantoea vagans]